MKECKCFFFCFRWRIFKGKRRACRALVPKTGVVCAHQVLHSKCVVGGAHAAVAQYWGTLRLNCSSQAVLPLYMCLCVCDSFQDTLHFVETFQFDVNKIFIWNTLIWTNNTFHSSFNKYELKSWVAYSYSIGLILYLLFKNKKTENKFTEKFLEIRVLCICFVF
jgi:hypothetical protein